MSKSIGILILIAAAVLGSPDVALAANRYVRADATGNQSGIDWTDAYTQLPSALVRGDTYYIAAGTYGAHTFADRDDGTKIIEIKAATQADHGTDAGWLSSYAGQAVFQSSTAISGGALLYFRTNYYTINGQYRGADWQSGYGFKLDNTNKKATVADILIGDSNPTVVHDITVQFVEINGSHPTGDVCNEQGVESPAGSYNLSFRYLYNHDVGNCNFFLRGGGGTGGKGMNIIVEYCFIARNYSSPAVHGEGFSCSEGLKNFTIRYNYITDMVGTAYIATPSGGSWNTTNVNNGPWYIYGNIFHASDKTHCGTGDGAIFFFDVNFTDNVYIYNNTFSRLGNKTCTGGYNGGILIEPVEGAMKADMKGVYVSNNLWFGASSLTIGCSTCSTVEWSYNSYFEMADNSASKDLDPNKQVSATCPVVNWQQENFNLLAPTSSGKPLPSSFDQDLNGVVRSADNRWDRGAIEYGGIATGIFTPPVAADAAVREKIWTSGNGGGTVTISYRVSERNRVVLDLFNAEGKKAATFNQGTEEPGVHQLSISRRGGPAPGLYVCRLTEGKNEFSGRVLLH